MEFGGLILITPQPGMGYTLGFISIMRYRDIDRGVGDLAIIGAPRYRTISCMKASLTLSLIHI